MSASGPSPSPAVAAQYPLAEAEAALRAGIHKKCVELAQQALAAGRLDAPAVARAWLVRGRCHVLDGDPDRAERSYAVAVRVQPDIALPTDDVVFARVQPEGRAQGSALTLTAATVVVGGEAGSDAAGGDAAERGQAPIVAVAVAAQDDLGLARAFVLVDADEREVVRAPIERAPDAVGDAFVRPHHRFSGFSVEGLRARLLDRHGNRLRDVPVVVDDAARRALVAAGATPVTKPVTAPPGTSWLTWAGAATASAGFVTAAMGGTAFTSAMQADDTRVVDDEAPALVAFVAGAGLFVVGGALVVVDQWPR